MYDRTRAVPARVPAPISTSLPRRAVVASACILGFAALTFVGANVYLPLKPVPVTLQTLFVLLAGAVIGGRRGALSQALYVGAGASGIPVFAGLAGGWGLLAGPTGGYLLSFLLVPILVGTLINRRQSVRWQILVFTSATALIFASGVAHLAVFYTGNVSGAIRVGLLPFVPGAVFKIAAATSIYRSFRALAGHRAG